MQTIPKCLLLPIDGAGESLRSAVFVSRLYTSSEVSFILCYFSAPTPPAYSGGVAHSAGLLKKQREFFQVRERDARRVFDHARQTLLKKGFPAESIQEHVLQRETNVAKQTCLLADIRKVDAVLVHKQVTSSLEGFIKGDLPSALLEYCINSPVWFTEGESEINPGKAAICIVNEEASLRIADHAGYMLADTGAKIHLLHAAKKIISPISCRPFEASGKFAEYADTPVRKDKISYLLKASAILADYGFDESRVQLTLIPDKGDTAGAILSWCASNQIGIIGLGHSQSEGVWGFLKTSVTKKILADFKNMAIWVAQ